MFMREPLRAWCCCFTAGPRTGGLLTSLLYVAFDLTLISGIVGIVSLLRCAAHHDAY